MGHRRRNYTSLGRRTTCCVSFTHAACPTLPNARPTCSPRLQAQLDAADQVARFCLLVLSDEIKIRNVPKKTIVAQLWQRAFPLRPKSNKKPRAGKPSDDADDAVEDQSGSDDDAKTDSKAMKNAGKSASGKTVRADGMPTDKELVDGYGYLMSMRLWSLTYEHVESIKTRQTELRAKYARLADTSPICGFRTWTLWPRPSTPTTPIGKSRPWPSIPSQKTKRCAPEKSPSSAPHAPHPPPPHERNPASHIPLNRCHLRGQPVKCKYEPSFIVAECRAPRIWWAAWPPMCSGPPPLIVAARRMNLMAA